MKKINKGQYGYIKFQRMVELLKTLIMLGLSIALYFLGIYSTGSNQNLLTFVAVLGCLPMAKFFVSFVMFTKAKGCSKELYSELNEKGLMPLFYDLYFTEFKLNFQCSALVYKKKSLIIMSEDSNIQINEGENHLKKVLENCGYDNVTVKIYTDKKKFIERFADLNSFEDEEVNIEFLKDNILSVSI